MLRYVCMFPAIADDPNVRQLIVELKSEVKSKKSNGDVPQVGVGDVNDELSTWCQTRARTRSRRSVGSRYRLAPV